MDEISLSFPAAGCDVSQAFGKQPNRPVLGKYSRTTPLGRNVRTFDSQGRSRGGNRQGIEKYIAARPGDVEYITQHLAVLTVTGEVPVQPSQSGRDVRLIAISQGNSHYVSAGGSTWTTATNNTGVTPPLNITGLMQSSVNNQLLFFADGTNWVYYDPVADALETWTATAGELPVDADDNKPRLTCTWRGRTVLSGLLLDPTNIFMSKVSDPFNFDYFPPLPIDPSAAWAGNVGPQGKTGDVVTALIPYSDDQLILGMDSSIAIFRGDPNAGGQIDLVTTSIGIAWGNAFAMDSAGIIYFFSNRTGIFAFVPGAQPQRISQSIDNLLRDVDTGEYGILLQWNDRFQQLHCWITLLSTPMATTHFVWEKRANAFWQDTFANTDHNPLCCCTFDGNDADDRMALIGSFDGYVRSVSSDALDDDGDSIESEVLLGPFLTNLGDSVMLREAQGILGETSGEVQYEVLIGLTAEEALSSTAVASGTWSAGRNFSDVVMRAGYAAYIRLSSGVPWAMESIRCLLGSQGAVRRRGK